MAKIIGVLALFLLISYNAKSQAANEVVESVITKIKNCKTISHNSSQKWGKIGEPTEFTPHFGRCSFKIVPNEKFINGYYHLEIKDILIDIYDGQKLARIDPKKNTLTVTDLSRFPDTNSISSKMLYKQSVLNVYNILLENKKSNFKNISLIGDTIINNVSCKRLSILLKDNIFKEKRNFHNLIVSVDPTLQLPVHFISTSLSIYGTQIIETDITDYKLNEIKHDYYFDLLAPQYSNLTKINYVEDKKQSSQVILNVGNAAPEFSLKGTNGQQVTLSAHRGKVVLLAFSGVNCGFCLVALKDLKQLKMELDPVKFSMLSIYSDETADNLKKYVDRYQVTYPVLYNGKEVNDTQRILTKYGVSGIPHFFLIDQNGNVMWNSVGYFEGIHKTIIDQVKRML